MKVFGLEGEGKGLEKGEQLCATSTGNKAATFNLEMMQNDCKRPEGGKQMKCFLHFWMQLNAVSLLLNTDSAPHCLIYGPIQVLLHSLQLL